MVQMDVFLLSTLRLRGCTYRNGIATSKIKQVRGQLAHDLQRFSPHPQQSQTVLNKGCWVNLSSFQKDCEGSAYLFTGD